MSSVKRARPDTLSANFLRLIRPLLLPLALISTISVAGARHTPGYNPERNAYFGDLHVHTRNSFDAFIFNVRATPEDAYRYSLGQAIQHAYGYPIRLRGGALDFTAVTDHAAYMGVLPALADPENPLSRLDFAQRLISSDLAQVTEAFQTVAGSVVSGKPIQTLNDPQALHTAWRETREAAEKYNQPGKFTTFIGYEYTSIPGSQNLHRNVIFKGSKVPDLPYSTLDSQNPEDLWTWLDDLRSRGIESLAIPHNSNVSNGMMFQLTDWAGNAIDADYALARMRNEPLVEVSQVKGTSETHPLLSPNDEWAGFEQYEYLIGTTIKSKISGGFVREAYRHGLEMEHAGGVNPYKFGLIGSSDTHNAGGPVEEPYYFGKVGVADGLARSRGSVPDPSGPQTGLNSSFSQWSAAGLAGVWAEENTRGSLFAAMRRKETFATSGPRIRVRFFAGYGFPDDMTQRTDVIKQAYRKGVPMGSDLKARRKQAPDFFAWATRDSNSAWLQRLQIIKGWVDDQGSHEQLFDAACSDGLAPNPKTYRCPDNGAKVDLSDCSSSVDKGAVELKTLWQDPEFEPSQRAFYYVRVIENPTCRWSSWDAMRAGIPPDPALPSITRERAWSSPIWYRPE